MSRSPANRIGISLANLRAALSYEQTVAEPVVRWLRARFDADAKRLRRRLAGKPFLQGDTLTIADISCSAYWFFVDTCGIDASSWPNVHAWLAKLRAQPAWRPPEVLLGAPR